MSMGNNPRFRELLEEKGFTGNNAERLDAAASEVWNALCDFDRRQLWILQKNPELVGLVQVAELWGATDGPGTRMEFRVAPGEVTPGVFASDRALEERAKVEGAR